LLQSLSHCELGFVLFAFDALSVSCTLLSYHELSIIIAVVGCSAYTKVYSKVSGLSR